MSFADLGRFPFVRTDRSVRTVRKWNASVLRTERTGSGRTGPALGVGPASSVAPRAERGKCAGILSVYFWDPLDKGGEIFRKWQGLLHGLVVSIRKLIILSPSPF